MRNKYKKEKIMIYKNCIDACFDCVKACERCTHEGKERMACCHTCAEMCTLVGRVTARGHCSSKLYKLCAEICDECAHKCGKLDDEKSKDCVKAAKKCADACRLCAEDAEKCEKEDTHH